MFFIGVQGVKTDQRSVSVLFESKVCRGILMQASECFV